MNKIQLRFQVTGVSVAFVFSALFFRHEAERRVTMKCLLVLVAVAFVNCPNVKAESAHYALTTVMGGATDLYRVGADGVWAKVRTVITTDATDGPMKRSNRALCLDGTVYAFDMVKDGKDNTGSYVRKFSPTGKYLGDLGACIGQAEGQCLSSDGKHLYLGYAFQTYSGRIDKISLADGAVTTLATGLGEIRQICCDGKGKVYAAPRNASFAIIDEATGAVTFSEIANVQGVAYDFDNDCLWWAQKDTGKYGTMTRDGTVTATYSDSPWKTLNCFSVAVIDGLPHFAVYKGKVYRRNADGTFTTVVSSTANYSDIEFFEVERKDVAKVYITLPDSGVRRYVVDNFNAWREDGWLFKNSPAWTTRPVACRRVGDYFYTCDQYENSDVGYFSIDRYDETGAFRGKLVAMRRFDGMKADNMTASPDGKSLYVTCFSGNMVLKVDIATGTTSVFATSGLSSPRGCSTDADGNLYVCNRVADYHVSVFAPDGTSAGIEYAYSNATSVYYDRDLDLVYIVGMSGDGDVYRKGSVSSIGSFSGLGNAMALDKISDGVLDNLVFGNWSGQVWTMPTGSTSPVKVLSSIGHVQHIYSERIEETKAAQPTAETLTFAAPDKGDWFVARDNACGADDPEAKTTVWHSSDRGVTWSVHSEVEGLVQPTLVCQGGKTVLFGEIAAMDGVRRVAGKTLRTNGSWVDDFTFSYDRAYEGFRLPGGAVQPAMMEDGDGVSLRHFIPLGIVGKRGVAGVSLADFTRADHSGCCFTMNWNQHAESYFTGQDFREARTNFKEAGIPASCPSADGGVMTFLPAVLRRSSTASRMPPEYVGVFTNWWADSTPELVGYARLPGGAKEIGVVRDSVSGLYWAATLPETDVRAAAFGNPCDARNTIALYASDNAFDWRLAATIRETEGTRNSVAFSRLCLALDGDDLVLVYGVAGSVEAGKAINVSEDGTIAFQRIVNFRAKRPSFERASEQFLMADRTEVKTYRFCIDPKTGEWHSNGCFPCPAASPIGIASVGRRVYLTCEKTGVYTYSTKGRCLGCIPPPSGRNVDAIRLLPGAEAAIVTDSGTKPNAVMKVDLATGVWTVLMDGTNDEAFKCPRGLAVASDGSFYVGFRDGNTIRHYVADGTSYETVDEKIGTPVALALDEVRGELYCGTRMGQVVKYDLRDGCAKTELTYGTGNMENGAFEIIPKDGKLYCVDGAISEIYMLDPDKISQEPVVLIGGGHFAVRGAFVDMSEHGLIMIVR